MMGLELRRALAVCCPLCRASPGWHCTSGGTTANPMGGRYTKQPHSIRVARSNGLAPTPRAGFYTRPKEPIDFELREREALTKLLTRDELAAIMRDQERS